MQPAGLIRSGNSDLQEVREARYALVEEVAGFGDQHGGVPAIDEAGVGEPVIADIEAVPVAIGEVRDFAFRQDEVRAFNKHNEVLPEQRLAVQKLREQRQSWRRSSSATTAG